MGWMKVTAQSVLTPRSKTITGTPLSQASSTAGVRVAVVEGEMMRAPQSPSEMNDWMSEICWLSSSAASATRNSPITPSSWSTETCSCIVMNPVTRQGLETEALEKHRSCGPSTANSVVSTISSTSIICIQGSLSSPSGSISIWASSRSKSARTKNSPSSVPASSDSPDSPASSATAAWSSSATGSSVGASVVHAARASPRTASELISNRLRRIVTLLVVGVAGIRHGLIVWAEGREGHRSRHSRRFGRGGHRLGGPASTPSPAAAGPVGEGEDDDHALDGGVEGRGHVELDQEPFEQPVGQGSGHRTHHPAAAPAQHHSAEHDGGDGGELHPLAHLGRHPREAADEDAGDGGQQAGEDEGGGAHLPHSRTGEPDGDVVVPGGDEGAAVGGSHEQDREDRDGDHDQP